MGAEPHTNTGRAARTRLRLVEAVRSTIEDEGAVSAGEVARRAGTSSATFYNYFETHDVAVAGAFDAAMVDLVAFVEHELDVAELLDAELTPFLEGWTWRAFGFFRENSVVFDLARSLHLRSPEIRTIYRDREAEALAHYTRFVRLGQRASVIRNGDTDAMAEAMMLTSQGWNHPRVLSCERNGALHREIVHAMAAHLALPSKQGDPA